MAAIGTVAKAESSSSGANTRSLSHIRSDLRGAVALATSSAPKHRERVAALLAEARACAGSSEEFGAVLRELSISDAHADYLEKGGK